MEVIKKEDNKLVMSYEVGEATILSPNGKNNTYKLKAGKNLSPIIEFPNGDTIILSWEEIIKLAIEMYKPMEVNYDTEN